MRGVVKGRDVLFGEGKTCGGEIVTGSLLLSKGLSGSSRGKI